MTRFLLAFLLLQPAFAPAPAPAAEAAPSGWGGLIPANDPRLRWEGRVRFEADGTAVYDWTAVRLHARFKGKRAAVEAECGQNYLEAKVDGEPVAVFGPAFNVEAPYIADLFVPKDARSGLFSLPALKPGEHSLVLGKRTAPNFGAVRLKGLRLAPGAELLQAPGPKALKLEFVGDSLTNAYGAEGPGKVCASLPPYENSQLSWARLAADALDAEAQLLAFSGFGVVRNYGAKERTSPDPYPKYYPRTVLTDAAHEWDRSQFVPALAAIFLGTNDYSTQPVPEPLVFEQGYEDLCRAVLKGRPGLKLLMIYPKEKGTLQERVENVAAKLKKEGVAVWVTGFANPTDESDLGCDWHPVFGWHYRWKEQAVEKLKEILASK